VLLVDWGEIGTVATRAGDRKLLCFCAVLGWSRWKYVPFVTGQRFPDAGAGVRWLLRRIGRRPRHDAV
jgi:transposase